MSETWLKKWSQIGALMLATGVLLPMFIGRNGGIHILWLHSIDIGLLPVMGIAAALVLVALPFYLRIVLEGKALAAGLLAYCATVLMLFCAVYSVISATLMQLIPMPMGIPVLQGIGLIPLILCLIAIGGGYHLGGKFPGLRYPFLLCGTGTAVLWLAVFYLAISVALEQPKLYGLLADAHTWKTSWHVLATSLLLLLTMVLATVFAFTGAGRNALRISFLALVTLSFVLLLAGTLVQLPVSMLNTAMILSTFFLGIKLGAILYGFYIMLASSLVSTLEQNTTAVTRARKSRRPSRKQPPAYDDELEQTLIVR